MDDKRKYMCATCIYRTDDKEFLAIPRPSHFCHEDDLGTPENLYPKLCAGSVGERGAYLGSTAHAEKWAKGHWREIMHATRRNLKDRYNQIVKLT